MTPNREIQSMTDEQELQLVALIRRHEWYPGPLDGCSCGWREQEGFDYADHLARTIRNLIGWASSPHELDSEDRSAAGDGGWSTHVTYEPLGNWLGGERPV